MTYCTLMAISSDEDLLQCELLQREEWEVLKSIYPDCVTSDLSNGLVRLEVPIDLGDPKTVILVNDNTIAADPIHEAPLTGLRLSLAALPSLSIHVIIPPSYPLHAPPEIVSVRAIHSWFPHLQALQRQLVEMWQDPPFGEAILYHWIEFIQSAEFLHTELPSTTDRDTIRIPHPAPDLLAPLLTDYDTLRKSTKFSENSYNCSVCLTAHKGSRCLQLSCEHVFCRSCLQDFWTLCIAEGDAGRVGCPDPACVKAGIEADEAEVAKVISEDGVKRWRWLRDKAALDKDPTIVHCPMPFCQTPILKPLVEENNGYDRLRTCPNCSYSFCSFCKRTWHGPLSRCPPSTTESFIREYIALPDDSPSRAIMERQFGKGNVQKLVSQWQDEQQNLQWLKSSTTACPGCSINVEKSLGCNHMTCTRCKVHFCYRCGDKLDGRINIYEHWSKPGACYSKLFDSDIDNEWEPIEGFV